MVILAALQQRAYHFLTAHLGTMVKSTQEPPAAAGATNFDTPLHSPAQLLGVEAKGAATCAQAPLSNYPTLSVKSIQTLSAPTDEANLAPDGQPMPHANIEDKTP
ncbi:hypothetical protein L7F22_064041 [Adiantum nelumboides]|nr:hypothetical protein [Adiantum nelumboides]